VATAVGLVVAVAPGVPLGAGVDEAPGEPQPMMIRQTIASARRFATSPS
jgi:hypothetical protein